MKSKNLRLGNYVKSRGGVTRITAIYPDHVGTEKEGKVPMKLIQPIVLNDDYIGKLLNPMKFAILKSSVEVFPHKPKVDVLKYVHQVQNLWFDKTGEELEFRKKIPTSYKVIKQTNT